MIENYDVDDRGVDDDQCHAECNGDQAQPLAVGGEMFTNKPPL